MPYWAQQNIPSRVFLTYYPHFSYFFLTGTHSWSIATPTSHKVWLTFKIQHYEDRKQLLQFHLLFPSEHFFSNYFSYFSYYLSISANLIHVLINSCLDYYNSLPKHYHAFSLVVHHCQHNLYKRQLWLRCSHQKLSMVPYCSPNKQNLQPSSCSGSVLPSFLITTTVHTPYVPAKF